MIDSALFINMEITFIVFFSLKTTDTMLCITLTVVSAAANGIDVAFFTFFFSFVYDAFIVLFSLGIMKVISFIYMQYHCKD